MPRGDGTGPVGLGPGTGRAAGYCAGYASPGNANPIWGGGFAGRGQWCRPAGGGRGFRWRNWFNGAGVPFQAQAGGFPAAGPAYSAGDREAEAEALKVQARNMEEALSRIKERLTQLTEQKTG